jgi:hypothetical protein
MIRSERPATGRLAWRKSTYSGAGNQCVEVASGASRVLVRDSKNPNAGALAFGGQAWREFMTRVREHGA